jgi:hypothetical protein
MNGLMIVIDKLGQALASADAINAALEQEIATRDARIAELEAQVPAASSAADRID